jgi:hypothetical protein
MGALDPEQRVEPVALAPGEPLAQLERVEVVGSAGVAGRNETAASWAVDIDAGWNGSKVVGVDMGSPHAATACRALATPAASRPGTRTIRR